MKRLPPWARKLSSGLILVLLGFLAKEHVPPEVVSYVSALMGAL